MGKKSKRRGGKPRPTGKATANNATAAPASEKAPTTLTITEKPTGGGEFPYGLGSKRLEMNVLIASVQEFGAQKNEWMKFVKFCDYFFYMDDNLFSAGILCPDELETPVINADIDFLEKLGKKSELAVYRVPAIFLLSLMFYHTQAADAAKFCNRLQKCIDVFGSIDSASEINRLESLFDKKIAASAMKMLKQVGERAQNFMSAFRSQSSRRVVKWDPERKQYVEVSFVPGDSCDCCGIKKSDDTEFHVCGRCKVTYYCSDECHQTHWKEKHKNQCRKKGEFRVGDRARLDKSCGTHGLPGDTVDLLTKVEPDEESESTRQGYSCFEAVRTGDSIYEKFVVSSKDLRNVRPAEWEWQAKPAAKEEGDMP